MKPNLLLNLKNILVLLGTSILLYGCRETEHTESITAEITAAQMEGRRAAGEILGPEWNDSSKLQSKLIEIKARQSRYIIKGQPDCARAFDSTFVSTIRTVNPDLAKKLTPDR